jgi:hypothetical protein
VGGVDENRPRAEPEVRLVRRRATPIKSGVRVRNLDRGGRRKRATSV